MAILLSFSWATLLSLLVVGIAVFYQVSNQEEPLANERERRAAATCIQDNFAVGPTTFISMGLTRNDFGWQIG